MKNVHPVHGPCVSFSSETNFESNSLLLLWHALCVCFFFRSFVVGVWHMYFLLGFPSPITLLQGLLCPRSSLSSSSTLLN